MVAGADASGVAPACCTAGTKSVAAGAAGRGGGFPSEATLGDRRYDKQREHGAE